MENSERRLESRFLCADLVRIVWHVEGQRAGIPADVSEAVLEDISPVGACVQLDSEIPVGAHVRLTRGEASLKGTVSYCVHRDDGYFAGIRLAADSHWSSGVFMPRHLTNPRALG